MFTNVTPPLLWRRLICVGESTNPPYRRPPPADAGYPYPDNVLKLRLSDPEKSKSPVWSIQSKLKASRSDFQLIVMAIDFNSPKRQS